MKQAYIRCLCQQYTIPDLGFTLKLGDVVTVDGSKAEASVDLKHARSISAVSVDYVAVKPPVDRQPSIPISGEAQQILRKMVREELQVMLADLERSLQERIEANFATLLRQIPPSTGNVDKEPKPRSVRKGKS